MPSEGAATSNTITTIISALSLDKLLLIAIVLVLIVVTLAVLFKEPLKQRLADLRSFRVGSVTMEFGQRLDEPKAQVRSIEKNLMASGITPAEKPLDIGRQSSRDAVVESWGALKQIVYDLCMANRIQMTPATGIAEAVRRLRDADLITPEVDAVITVLNELGQQVVDDTDLKPLEKDAKTYMRLAEIVRSWLMLNMAPTVIEKEPEPPPPVQPEPPVHQRSATRVGDYFQHPGQGPIAILDAIEGPLRGKRIMVEKEQFRIGSNADNDLCLWQDEYVSHDHASLRYEDGSLFIYDDGSRNGTLVNDNRIAQRAALFRGDRIRIGQSVFQVSEAPAPKGPAASNTSGTLVR
jgi:hypothetical protein